MTRDHVDPEESVAPEEPEDRMVTRDQLAPRESEDSKGREELLVTWVFRDYPAFREKEAPEEIEESKETEVEENKSHFTVFE